MLWVAPGRGLVAKTDKYEVPCMLKQTKLKSVLAQRRKAAKTSSIDKNQMHSPAQSGNQRLFPASPVKTFKQITPIGFEKILTRDSAPKLCP
jgi:hypothetical protein